MSDPALPTCPAPTTSFPAYLTHLTRTLDALTTSASALPPKSDLSFHRTLDRKFGKELDEAGDEVLRLTERLLGLVEIGNASAVGTGSATRLADGKEVGKGKGKGKGKIGGRRKMREEEDVVDGFRRGVVEVVDSLLEDADSCLDDLKGERKKASLDIQESFLASAGTKLPGPFNDPSTSSSSSTSKRPLPSSLLHASHLPKPQLLFPDYDPTGNSLSRPAFRPSLETKPHSMVPLSFIPPLDYEMTEAEHLNPTKAVARREREERSRLHPYFYETRHLPYPTAMFTHRDPIPPRSFEDTPFEFVDTKEALERLVQKLVVADEIAIDLEHHSLRSYYGFTCLIQISTREGDWVVDSLKLRGELREGKLGGVLADPSIVKVFHGADSDVVWLQKDFDIYMVNLFDTYHATKVLDYPAHSLASLLSMYCSFPADKRYQQADWRLRPLTPEMMHYARADTHFLLYVYDNLRNALLEKSRPSTPAPDGGVVEMNAEEEEKRRRWQQNPQKAMRAVLERSEDTALKVYEREGYDEDSGRGNMGWAGQGRRWLPRGMAEEEGGVVWKRVHAWRDRVAREEDESPFHVLSNEIMKNIAMRPPSTLAALKTLVTRSDIATRRVAEVFDVIEKSREEWKEVLKSREREARAKVEEVERKKKELEDSRKAKEPPTSWEEGVWGEADGSGGWGDAGRQRESGLFGGAWVDGETSKAWGESAALNGREGQENLRKKQSGLFGATIGLDEAGVAGGGGGFDAVRQGIFESLGFRQGRLDVNGNVEVHADDGANERIEPETVPFKRADEWATLPSAERVTTEEDTKQDNEDIGQSQRLEGGAAREKRVDDGVVNVKRKKERKRRQAAPVQEATGVETPTKKTKQDKERKQKKEKVKSEDIPAFTYEGEKNLLDNPEIGRDRTGSKKKRDKRKGAGASNGGMGMIETPRFGQRPADRSQPKSGNKSGTFGV